MQFFSTEKTDYFDNAGIYGVFDGHGGHKASEYCKVNLLSALRLAIDEQSEIFQHQHIVKGK